MIALKALSYHNDIDLSEALPEDVEQLNVSLRRIHRSIARLDLNHLPKVAARTGFRWQREMHNEIG